LPGNHRLGVDDVGNEHREREQHKSQTRPEPTGNDVVLCLSFTDTLHGLPRFELDANPQMSSRLATKRCLPTAPPDCSPPAQSEGVASLSNSCAGQSPERNGTCSEAITDREGGSLRKLRKLLLSLRRSPRRHPRASPRSASAFQERRPMGRRKPYFSSLETKVRRDMPMSFAARLWFPAQLSSAAAMRLRSSVSGGDDEPSSTGPGRGMRVGPLVGRCRRVMIPSAQRATARSMAL